MTFQRVRRLITREPVVAGFPRMQPEQRELATRLMTRFGDGDAAPLPVADEGAALALWGPTKAEAFLEWYREQGGLARVLEVLVAATAYERVSYEWDGSVWALRRARPAAGVGNLGAGPWLWLRDQVAGAKPAERAAARAVAGRASRAWLVRAAIALVFPDDGELWTPADDAELRHADIDDRATCTFGVLVAMRGAKLDRGKLERAWNIGKAIPAKRIVEQLGARAVAPLRLIGAYDALARLGDPDALRAVVELADREGTSSATRVADHADDAWAAIETIAPTKASIAALAPMFTTQRPRRTLGLHLARAWFGELVAAAPDAAEALGDPFVAGVIAETGVRLPADTTWTSPWASVKPLKSQTKSAPGKPADVAFEDRIHWAAGRREQALETAREGKSDRELERKVAAEAKTGKAFMLYLGWMSDAAARRTWAAIPAKAWYGQVDDVEHLLARFGLDELDSILAFVKAKPDTVAALAGVESPRVAPVMARAFALLKKQQAVGKAWLERFPEAATIGLLVDRATADSKQRDADDKALAHLVAKHGKLVAEVSARAGTTVSVAAAAPTLPPRKPKLPEFLEVSRLSRPIRGDGGAALTGESLVEFVQLLKATLPAGHPELDAIGARYTTDSLARFAWSLFRQWLFAKGPPKDRWALYAVGKFPDDDNARALGRLARVWAPQGNSARAQEAVETLAMMRTKAGLLEIHDIAKRVQSKALKARAEQVFENVAESLGLAAEDLADKLVPELSDAELVFGGMHVEFDASLTPRLDGKLDPDDAARWKELKRLCGSVARGQHARLEQAMAEAHRMPFGHFAEVYLMHSLIRHISRALVWGAYRDGRLAFAFGVDDGGAVDVHGKLLELPQGASYGVVHPAELTAGDRAAWAKRLGDQPFPQLGREIFVAADAADCQARLAALCGHVVPTARLLGLQRHGWRRGDSPQGGRYYTMQRAGDGWFAELAFAPGIYLGSPTEEPTQALEAIVVRADTPPPVAILSDLQRDLRQLVSR